MVSGSSNQTEKLRINSHQTGSVKFKMSANKLELLIYQLVARQDMNAILTAERTFLGSINPTKQLRIISHQTGNGKSTENIFPPNRK